jgi:hypothetical protein
VCERDFVLILSELSHRQDLALNVPENTRRKKFVCFEQIVKNDEKFEKSLKERKKIFVVEKLCVNSTTMGFSALQGKGVHEALLARQDAEIRLIETMRRCLSQKAKCDRDYATTLVNVAQTGLKVDRGDDLTGKLMCHLSAFQLNSIYSRNKPSSPIDVICPMRAWCHQPKTEDVDSIFINKTFSENAISIKITSSLKKISNRKKKHQQIFP